jgi:hypothetical protein
MVARRATADGDDRDKGDHHEHDPAFSGSHLWIC